MGGKLSKVQNEESKVESKVENGEKKENGSKSKYKKKPLKAIRDALWEIHFGKSLVGNCYCCQVEIQYNKNYEAGHVEAEAKGGKTELSNLRPVCRTCNRSMGTINMEEFKKSLNVKIYDSKDSKADAIQLDIDEEYNALKLDFTQKLSMKKFTSGINEVVQLYKLLLTKNIEVYQIPVDISNGLCLYAVNAIPQLLKPRVKDEFEKYFSQDIRKWIYKYGSLNYKSLPFEQGSEMDLALRQHILTQIYTNLLDALT